MATAKAALRTIIEGVEYVLYRGRLMPIVAGGEQATEMTEDERRDRVEELRLRQKEIATESGERKLTGDERAEIERNAVEIKEHEEVLAERDQLRSYLETLDGNSERQERADFQIPRPGATRGEDIWDLSTVRSSLMQPQQQAGELRDRARQAIERSRPKHPDVDHAAAKGYMEWLVTDRDLEDGRLARYLLAVGSPTYKRAFGKYLQYRDSSAMTREEQVAWHAGQVAERALSLTGAAGGFAVPFELDPTLINVSNGFTNPIRRIARVIPITVDEWRGVSWSGITAAYEAEATQVAEQSPTIAQPSISTEKAQSWVPFSIEIGQDWAGLQAELAAAFAEAKDTLEATKFISGTGTNEPFGVAVGTTNTVNAAAGADAFTLANLYALLGALPPRYRAQAALIGDWLILARIRQFEGTAGTNAGVWEPGGLQPDMPDRVLGKPIYEASEMPDNATTGNKFLIAGDFKRYVIVERVGLAIDYVPHVFGAAQRPTGQRGLYAYWRNSAKVVDANAFRALIGTA